MAEPLKPNPAIAFGRENWLFVPTFADYTAPTAAVVGGGSSLDFSQILFADGANMPTQSVNRVDAERRFADTQTFERKGAVKFAGGTLQYQLDPQAAAGTAGKTLWEKWLAGVSGFLVQRQNVPRATAIGVGQFVHVFPVDISSSIPGRIGDGEASEFAGSCDYFITNTPVFMVALT